MRKLHLPSLYTFVFVQFPSFGQQVVNTLRVFELTLPFAFVIPSRFLHVHGLQDR